MTKNIKFFIYGRLLPHISLLLATLLCRTCRVVIVDPENENAPLEKDKSLIYASWHQRFFPGVTFFATRKPIAIMISRSRDGEFIAKVADILGWHPIRGSSSKGGVSALIKLKKRAAEGYRIGHIVDGPKGPFGSVKPGIVMMAQATGLAIVPVITSAERHWQAKSWDRFMIPKPFTRIIIRFGEPFYVPRQVNSDQFEDKRKEIEDRLSALYEETDRIWQDPGKIKKIFDTQKA